MLKGRPRLEDFEGETYNDGMTRELMARVGVAADPAADVTSGRLGEQFGTRLTLVTTRGERLVGTVDKPLGRGPDKPLPTDMFEAKFFDGATRVVSEDAARDLVTRFGALEEASIAEISVALATATAEALGTRDYAAAELAR